MYAEPISKETYTDFYTIYSKGKELDFNGHHSPLPPSTVNYIFRKSQIDNNSKEKLNAIAKLFPDSTNFCLVKKNI